MSRLRITGGHARGRILREPVARGVRPTSERVREALFSVLGQDLTGLRFLDACAGSGVMALEAWSRGAEVTAYERDRQIARSLRRRLAEIDSDITVHVGDVRKLKDGRWNIGFADPPYALEPGPFLDALLPRVDRLLFEVAATRDAPDTWGEHRLDRVRRYGDSAVWTFLRTR